MKASPGKATIQGASHPTSGRMLEVNGVTPSCAEIRALHRRVASPDIPLPRRSWIRSHSANGLISIKERGPEEPSLREDQSRKIRSLSREIDCHWVNTLGEHQAGALIAELTELRKEHSKKILKDYYSSQGYDLPKWVIDQAYKAKSQPFRVPRSRPGWSVIVILLCLVWLTLKLLEAAHK